VRLKITDCHRLSITCLFRSFFLKAPHYGDVTGPPPVLAFSSAYDDISGVVRQKLEYVSLPVTNYPATIPAAGASQGMSAGLGCCDE